ncbi:MAG: hypothetical protein PHY48_00270 [Candidatus Cloacimonetes bacterium]|nr:hypothetical protein [Candidatus Cloacimonadota bacterium]
MKETKTEQRIRARMLPGAITLSGFIGKDKRALYAIISADEQELERLGKTAEELADRMLYFTDASFSTFDGTITVDEHYIVETEVTRGKLPCPFAHGGVFRKAITKLTNTKNNTTASWSFLNIHLIKEHHFFEGKGSTFRIEPAKLVEVLF